MSKRIVDQYGKPFKPSVEEEILRNAPAFVKEAATQPQHVFTQSKFEEWRRIEALRKSCGAEPEKKAITFRRSLPYAIKPE